MHKMYKQLIKLSERKVQYFISKTSFSEKKECTTTDINVKTGVCTTSEECSAGSGTASGQCALGFGGQYLELSERGFCLLHDQ